jgi:hypothetical protein
VTVCVYGLTTDRRVPRVEGARLRLIRRGRVAAIVADVRRTPAPTATQLRQYHRVVAAIGTEVPALLPARFGTVMDEAELATVLAIRAQWLLNALQQLRGRVQMTIRMPDETLGARTPTRARPARSRGGTDRSARRPGTAYLQARAAAAAAGRDVPGFEPVRTAVSRWVRDERIERAHGVTTVYHLVPRHRVGAYLRSAASAIAHADLRAVLSGPFPPYAFTSW